MKLAKVGNVQVPLSAGVVDLNAIHLWTVHWVESGVKQWECFTTEFEAETYDKELGVATKIRKVTYGEPIYQKSHEDKKDGYYVYTHDI